jgi:ElaB/YqjD/DUF883 family membrane-anchored ribosome-binding protein
MRTETQDAKDRLIEEFKKVMDNAEELLKATADQTGDEIGAARARAEESLREARRKLGEIEGTLMDRAKAAAKATDHLVREKPWQSITAATAVGVILGMLISRR